MNNCGILFMITFVFFTYNLYVRVFDFKSCYYSLNAYISKINLFNTQHIHMYIHIQLCSFNNKIKVI